MFGPMNGGGEPTVRKKRVFSDATRLPSSADRMLLTGEYGNGGYI